MSTLAFAILASTLAPAIEDAPARRTTGSDRDPASAEATLCDRLHQTFQLLCDVTNQAYVEHFRDEPDKLAVVHYYAGRLALAQNDKREANQHFSTSVRLAEADSYYRYLSSLWLGENPAAPAKLENTLRGVGPGVLMRMAIGEVQRTDYPDAAETARYLVNQFGFQPHVVLQRGKPIPSPELIPEQWTIAPQVAVCPLYDPQLLWVHRRLAERKAGIALHVQPAGAAAALEKAQQAVRTLRQQPENSELSLRRFLDRHRAVVWELGWLHRRRGLELERTGDVSAAREHYLRGWAIGDALFPVSERGRMDRLDPVFLAELGDVYAGLGRYDLMLRYMYSEQGLPARYEMARPIAELARVAESVRLARAEETPAELDDEALPETVSQILFEQPVVPQPTAPDTPAAPPARVSGLGWVFLAGGGVLLLGAVVWCIGRAARKPIRV